MEIIGKEVISALIGAVFGLILSVIFDDALRSMKRNMKRRFKRLFSIKKDSIPHLFSVEGMGINFYVIEGDGVLEFESGNIECRMVKHDITLPDELQLLKDDIAQSESEKEAKGLDYKWNGPLYGLSQYRTSRTGEREIPTALFHFHLTDYYTFLATNTQLDTELESGQTIREKYLPYKTLDQVQPILANGFGVVLVIITNDENIILTKRTNISGARANEIDVSVVEGVHPSFDQDLRSDGPDLFRAAARGANEELGIDLDEKCIHFLGYGIDTEFYQWNIIGYAEIPETAKNVKSLISRGASGKWESTQLLFENFTSKNIAKLMINENMWATAKVALYWTAVNQLGKNDINRAIHKHKK